MEIVVVNLHTLIQDSHHSGSDDEHMISRVYFSLEARGVVHRDYFAEIKQVVGSGGGQDAPLEVSYPVGYRGPFNHEEFSMCVENYYRELVRSMVNVGPGAQVRMQHNIFVKDQRIELHAEPAAGW